uniref:GPI transamidase subunit PIG-U n=1 Tax=Syphacia muris TaxID=451379 RepID=A0A0N5AIP2_9BILA
MGQPGQVVRSGRFNHLQVWIFGSTLRIMAWLFCGEFLKSRAELVVPQNSFRRLADGVSLQANGISPYDGDMFHIFKAYVYLLHYLLNPISIVSCSIFSLTVLNNFFWHHLSLGWLILGAALCSFLSHLALYPAVFLCVLIIRAKTMIVRLSLIAIFLISLIVFIGINYLLSGSFKFLDSTYMFLLDLRDLTPNVGVFWYFFIEVFNHFRLFFLWVFQVNFLIYVFPLLLTVRNDPFLLLHLYLILISVFSSYPSMTDSLIYLSLLPVFYSLHRHIRWGLLISGTLVTCTVLASIMSIMWLVIGSANANFYFAVALAYSVAQIFLLTDLLYAYLHKKVAEDRGPEKAVMVVIPQKLLASFYL